MHRIYAAISAKRVRLFLALIAMVLAAPNTSAQELVLTPAHGPQGVAGHAPAVVFPDLGAGLPDPAKSYVIPLDAPPYLAAHGLTLIAADRALMSQEEATIGAGGSVTLVDTAAATRIDSYALPQALPVTMPPTLYDGYGTLAINPARTHILAISRFNTLWVIPAPFDHTAVVTTLLLPSGSGTPQTRAIAFDSVTGRAYVAVRTGILAIDPPYTSIAFTIPSSNGSPGENSGAIAMSPDNATLVATRGADLTFGPELRIFHAPFSAASVPGVLTITASSLDAMTFTPDGSKLMVVEASREASPALPRVYVVAAPFSGTSTVETLAFESGGFHQGFEDVDISADGQFAALSGGGGDNEPFVVLKAPFAAAGFSFYTITIPIFPAPYNGGSGRGNGTARFWSTAIAPLPPQVFVDGSAASVFGLAVAEGNSGTTDVTIPIHLSGSSALAVTVDYTTKDGTPSGLGIATAADNDYIPASGTLTFAPGETTKNIVVKVVGDTKYEADELFKVVISNPVNATLFAPGFADTALVKILNDDAVVLAAITSGPPPDGVVGVPYFFQLTGIGADPFKWTSQALPLGLTLDPATGVISGTPTLLQTVTFVVSLSDAVDRIASALYTIVITGVGQPALVTIPSLLDFGARTVGSTSPPFPVIIRNGGSGPLVLGSPFVSIAPGSDFALATGPGACADAQTIPQAGQCNLYFTFTPLGAGTRSLVVNLVSNAAPATLTLTGIGQGAPVPVVSIANAAAVIEGNAGTTPMTFAVSLSAPASSAVSVTYAVVGGTANNGIDYTLAGTGTLTFAPGVITQSIVVNVIGDTMNEADATVIIGLANPVGVTFGTATATGTIIDDDRGGATPAQMIPTLSAGAEGLLVVLLGLCAWSVRKPRKPRGN